MHISRSKMLSVINASRFKNENYLLLWNCKTWHGKVSGAWENIGSKLNSSSK